MDNKYTALIVEPRKHPSLEFVLDNFLSNLDDKWIFIIYCGLQNQSWVENIINTKFDKYKYKITIKQLGVDNLTIDDYNKLMTNVNFINQIPTEIFLIFQTDTMICEGNKDLINDYLKYDYVGAPWNSNWVPAWILKNMNVLNRFNELNNESGFVGNGGLSLRRKSKMLEILNNCPYTKDILEDVYYSIGCKNIHINKPSFELAKLFSIETIYSPKSFGIHKSWNYIPNILDDQCTNYSKLVELNNPKIKEEFNKNIWKSSRFIY